MILKLILNFLVAVLTIFVLIKMIKSNMEHKKISADNKATINSYYETIKSRATYTEDGYIEDKSKISKYIDNLQKSHTIIFNFNNIIDKESFWDEIQKNFTCDCDWFGRNFDALNDALNGNCGLFEENEPVNISIINIKKISENKELQSLFVTMLDVILDLVYKIKSDDYCLKYIEDLKNNVTSINYYAHKFISLKLYENDIV